MFLHSVQQKDIEILEGIFAYLTEEGWVIPEWINELRGNFEGEVRPLKSRELSSSLSHATK